MPFGSTPGGGRRVSQDLAEAGRFYDRLVQNEMRP